MVGSAGGCEEGRDECELASDLDSGGCVVGSITFKGNVACEEFCPCVGGKVFVRGAWFNIDWVDFDSVAQ